MIEEETYELPTEADLNLPSREFLSTFEAFDQQIDGDILERAWKSYDATQQQILLEGDKKAWMVCSFYTAVWQATPYSREPPYLYSLWQLLKTCNISVLEFFDKLTKWVDMINGARRMYESVSRVQSTLAVSIVIYKKYLPIFRSMFRIHKKSDSDKKMAITTAKLFEYIWVLFVALKKLLPSGLEDLLNSFHILLCIIDLIAEELHQTKSEVLNEEFWQLMSNSGAKSTLDFLCQQFDGVELDARHMLHHWVLPKLCEFQSKGVLRGKNDSNLEKISLLTHWPLNVQELKTEYESHMMRRAEIDERMFISHVAEHVDMVFNESLDDSAMTMLRRGNLDSSWAVDADLLLRMSTQRCMEKVQLSAKPLNTPLSARSYIISSEQFCPATPISASAYRTQKLHDLFDQDFMNSDSEFQRLVGQCRDNPKLFISKRVEALEQLITKRVESEASSIGPNFDKAFSSQLQQRLSNTEMFFYRLLQKTVMYDRQRNPRAEVADLSAILHKPDFITSLYICAFEIVLMTYGSEREFPWSIDVTKLDTTQLPAINFYKIIEVVVRAEPELSRDMVKHLNRCEERVLEEIAWAVDSPLWAALSRRADGVPSCAAVTNEGAVGTPRGNNPPSISKFTSSSPMKPLERSSVKRRLEFGEDDTVPRKKHHEDGYSLPSGITLFFRKVYYLAAIRLTDLCDRIRMEELVRARVWTLFEHVLRTETSLMLGRHIDQNLMCCIYITSKISNLDLSFHKIMHHYKHQPQASSRIYRHVLAERTGATGPNPLNTDDGASRDSIGSFSGHGTKLRSGSAVPQPNQASAPATPEPQADFIDLIKYYNRIVVPRVEDFVKKLHPSNPDSKENIVAISQMPKLTGTTLSPRRNIGDQLTIIPMSSVPHAPRRIPASRIP